MNKLMEILVLTLLIAAANTLPRNDGKSRLKIYLNNLKTSFHKDEKN
jgi:hypothetical protein